MQLERDDLHRRQSSHGEFCFGSDSISEYLSFRFDGRPDYSMGFLRCKDKMKKCYIPKEILRDILPQGALRVEIRESA